MQQSLKTGKQVGVIRIERGTGYAVLLSILSVIMMYKVPVVNMGFATVLIAVSMVYAVFLILTNFQRIKFSLVLPICLYALWNMIRSGGDASAILLCIAIIVHVTAISTGCVNGNVLKKMIVGISCIAAIGVIIQQIVHIVFSVHVPMIATDYILDSMKDSYLKLLLTGYGEIDSGYRPSAFFLEPSHFSQYCFIGIAISLLDEKTKNIPKAILISIGILCTTSGMGMAILVAVWIYYYFMRVKSVSLVQKIQRIAIYAVIGIIVVVVALQIPSIQFAISRVFGTEAGEYNAIDGRFFWWDSYMTKLSGTEWIFGLGADKLPDVYFTGIMELLYCYGIIGAVLFYGILLRFFKGKSAEVRFVTLMLGVLMIFANFTGFISLIFYFGTLINFAIEKQNKNAPDNKGSVIA